VTTTPLRLQPDTYVVDLPDGVEVVTGRGAAFLRGESARRWVRRVLAAVDGTRSVDQILDRATPAQRELAERIVATALGVGAVREACPGDEHRLSRADRERFAAEIEFLGMYVPDPHAAFRRHRRRSVAVFAPASQQDRFRQSFARTGVDDIHPVCVAGGAEVARAAGDLPDVDIVVQVVSASASTEADAVERHCRATGATLVQLVLDGPTAWWCPIGPVRWSDVRARLDGLNPHRASWAVGTRAGSVAPPATLTNMVVQDVFRSAAGSGAGGEPPAVVEFALDPATQRRHPVRPHPFTRPAHPDDDDGFRRRMTALARRPAVAMEDFSRAAVTLMDSRLGLFSEITQGALAQLPLKAAAAAVSDPVGLLGAGHRLPVVTEADLDFPAARRRVGMRAIATYATLMVDPRRLVRTSAAFAATAAASPAAAVAELRRGRAEASVQALDLLGDRVVPIDARAVFPALEPATRPYVAPPGVGAGLGWRPALADGLLQHCTRLAVERVAAGGQVVDRVDVRAGRLPARVRRAMTVLDGLGRTVEVYDIGGTLDVPALVCTVDGTVAAGACGASYLDALETCLLAALRAEQDAAPAPGLELVSAARGVRTRPVPTPARLTVDALARRLAAVAGPPLVVPLDHDPEVAGVLPVTVRVVLGAG
jgi:hypothetical protein